MARVTHLAVGLGLAVSALSPLLGPAEAQVWEPRSQSHPPAMTLRQGVTIRAQVDLMFPAATGRSVEVLKNSFEAVGENATTEYIFRMLDEAAQASLNKALAQGARAGHVTVVATSCEFGSDGDSIRTIAPIGVFINSTQMLVGEDGVPAYRTKVEFIPDITRTAPAPANRPG